MGSAMRTLSHGKLNVDNRWVETPRSRKSATNAQNARRFLAVVLKRQALIINLNFRVNFQSVNLGRTGRTFLIHRLLVIFGPLTTAAATTATPTTAPVQALWPQSGASNSKCAGANHEHAVASQNACQAEAVAAGHEYYQFSDHGYYYMCATAATCSSHITGTQWTWRIYAQATTAVPTPTPPSANCLSWCAVNTNPWSKKC